MPATFRKGRLWTSPNTQDKNDVHAKITSHANMSITPTGIKAITIIETGIARRYFI
jgi:hypothetical protein